MFRPNANDAPGLQTRAQAIMEALLGLGVDKSQLGIYYGEYLPKGKGVVNQPVKFILKIIRLLNEEKNLLIVLFFFVNSFSRSESKYLLE